jgi:hypothetical protein
LVTKVDHMGPVFLDSIVGDWRLRLIASTSLSRLPHTSSSVCLL